MEQEKSFIWTLLGLNEIILGVLMFGFSFYLFNVPFGIIWSTLLLPLGIFFMIAGILVVKHIYAGKIISLAVISLIFISIIIVIIIQMFFSFKGGMKYGKFFF
jgi:hypothetical protein